MTPQQEQALAHDLDLCDLGIALSKGKTRQTFIDHRTACFAALRAMNEADGLNAISDEELLRELAI